MEEIWRPIKYYEGIYEISNFGRIKSLERMSYNSAGQIRRLKERILKVQKLKHQDYYQIMLHKDTNKKHHRVHRLVAMAFIPNPENKPEVNHIDGNGLNNRVDNLEWATRSENILHAYQTGIKKYHYYPHVFEELAKINSRSVKQISRDGELIRIFNSITEASKQTGAQPAHITSVAKGKRKTAAGYVWEYNDVFI